MVFKHYARALILLLSFFSQAFAQGTPPAAAAPSPSPQTDEQRKEQQEMKRKALDLIDVTVKDSESFKLPENRVRIRMMAANTLWEHDEARARLLFKEASASLAEVINNQEAAEPHGRNLATELARNLRREMLMMLGTRDPRMARDFLRATRAGASSEQANASHVVPVSDLQLELGLATQVASTDPKQAFEIGRETLSQGLSPDLITLIAALQQKDSATAARLASEIVMKLRSVKLDSNEAAKHLALNLLRAATQSPGDAPAGASPTVSLLEQSALRELTEMVAVEALRPGNGELMAEMQTMMSVIEKYAPTRVAQFKRKAEPNGENTEIVEATTNQMQEWSKYQQVMEKGSAQEMLDAALKAPEGMREMLYLEATTKLIGEGNPERARSIINENVKDPQQRQMLLDQLEQFEAATAAYQGKIEPTRKRLATLRTNEERVALLAQLASGAAQKGEKKAALQLLEEARGLISGKAKNIKQLEAQLLVARAYATLDPARSLEILEPIVDQVNELLGAAIVLGGFFTEEFIRDDEVMLEPVAMVTVEFFNMFMGDIKELARSDFERTKGLAYKFQRDEIRIMAQLLIAQSILSPEQSRDIEIHRRIRTIERREVSPVSP